MPPPPRALPEELVEEILLRFPPHEPARLVRAALVCRLWRRLVSGPVFRRRFREFHRGPPMLGFLLNIQVDPDASGVCRFVPTAAFCLSHAETRRWRVLDARHGRVLLQPQPVEGAGTDLLVWDVITKEQWKVPNPDPSRRLRCLAAAVLCSVTTGACDHLDCHRGPFLVVLVGFDRHAMGSFLYTYSSESATWSDPVSAGCIVGAARMPSVCVGNALCFGFAYQGKILKYDLQSGQISRMETPTQCILHEPSVFATTESGELGMATIRGYKLYIWSRTDGTRYSSRWIQTRVIELQRLLPVDALLGSAEPYVAGFADRTGVFYLWASGVLYTVHVETCEVKKFYEGHTIYNVVPYMTFYTPALGAAFTGEGASASGSSA